MANQSSVNLQIANLSVGFSIGGGNGGGLRTWTFNGTGNTTLSAQQAITLTLPNRATDTIVGYGDYSAKGVILVGTGTGTFTALAVGTNTFVLTADSTQSSGVKWAVGGGGAGALTSWVDATGSTQAMSTLVGYYADNATAVAFTLPTTAAKYDSLAIVGIQGAWNIIQGAGQNIIFGNIATTVGAGGSLASTNANDCLQLICTVANTQWLVRNSVGNITYV